MDGARFYPPIQHRNVVNGPITAKLRTGSKTIDLAGVSSLRGELICGVRQHRRAVTLPEVELESHRSLPTSGDIVVF
jgi:hypothetical protein